MSMKTRVVHLWAYPTPGAAECGRNVIPAQCTNLHAYVTCKDCRALIESEPQS